MRDSRQLEDKQIRESMALQQIDTGQAHLLSKQQIDMLYQKYPQTTKQGAQYTLQVNHQGQG